MNYKQYIYDFDSIENVLEEALLNNKTKFNDHENLKFVTYQYEGFRNRKSDVLSDFIYKYSQIELKTYKKRAIEAYIKNKYDNGNNNSSILNIYFSIQLLINYLTEEKKGINDNINTIIKELPFNISIFKECIEFFEEKEIKVEELYEIYIYFEKLCFKHIITHLNEYYTKKINEQSSIKINDLFNKKHFNLITKKDLASACRKLVSRYLVGKRNDIDINENNKLYLYLNKEELWSKELWNNEDKILQDIKILEDEELTVGQCYDLYKLLGED